MTAVVSVSLVVTLLLVFGWQSWLATRVDEMAEERLTVWPPAAGPVPRPTLGLITPRALLLPSGDLYARPASMRSTAACPLPPALAAQRAERT